MASGPVAQRIEQQPSKLTVAGSIPAGVANDVKYLRGGFGTDESRIAMGRRSGEQIVDGSAMKPQLTLLPRTPSAADIAKLFERITGRRPTEQEMERVRPVLAKALRVDALADRKAARQ